MGSVKQSLQKLNTFVFERRDRAKSTSPFMLIFIRRLTPDKYKTIVDSWLKCKRTLRRWGRHLHVIGVGCEAQERLTGQVGSGKNLTGASIHGFTREFSAYLTVALELPSNINCNINC